MGGDEWNEWCWGTGKYYTLWRQDRDFILISADPTHINLTFNKISENMNNLLYWASFDPDLALMYHIAL